MRTPGFKEELERRRRLGVCHVLAGYRQRTVAEFLGCSSQFGLPLDESLSPGRRRRFGGKRSFRPSAKTYPRTRTPSLGLVSCSPTSFGFPTELWTAARVARVIYRKWRIKFHPRYLNQWLAERRITPQKPRFQAREQDEVEVQRWLREDWPRIKKVRRGGVPTLF